MPVKLDWKKPLASGQTPEDMLEEFYFDDTSDERGAQLLSIILGQEVTVAAYRAKRQSLGFKKSKDGRRLIPSSDAPIYDNPPTASGDILTLADLHIPFYDSRFINRCFNISDLWELETLVLAGDVLDLVALSGFSPEFGEDKPSLEEELESAGEFFDACQGFKRVVWLGGNHERRLLKKLESGIQMERLARMITDLETLETSNYQWCRHEAGWIIGHASSASVIPARVPMFLTRKYPNDSIATGHPHLWGIVQTEDGKRLAVDIGVSCDPARLAYIATRLSTRPAVSQGAFILKRGKPWLLSPLWTDWRALRSIKWD